VTDKITRTNAMERLPHQFISEASEIGMVPLSWPERLETDLGNGRPFWLHRLERDDYTGEVYLAHYTQELGNITLRVFND